MRLPVRREPPEDSGRSGAEFRRLRARLLADLDRWPELLAESRRAARPHATLEQTADAYLLDVDLPGVPPEDVDVEVGLGRLVVTARRPGRHHLLPERSGTARRLRLELTLPPDVDGDAVSGHLERGVLHLRLPTPVSASRRRIPVRTRRPEVGPTGI